MEKINVLVVEDERITARDIKMSLEKLNYTVCGIVATGEDAIHKAIELQPDIVLMDIALQGKIDGVEAAKQICTKSQIPVIFLTAYSDQETLERANATQPFGYLLKPFEDKLLHITLQIALSRHQATLELQKALAISEGLRQEAEAQHELKSQFVSVASHEFRTPLCVIQSSAEILQKYGTHWSKEEQQRYLKRIQDAADSINQLLEDVLTLENADSRQLTINPQPIDIVDFCQDLVDMLRLYAGEQYSLTFSSKGDCTQVILDEKLLWHILNNLLSNAIKYSPQGSQVSLILSCQEQQICFQVQDQGIGISPEDQKRLFQPFSRATNVGKIPGTGLGLSIVKRAVELQEGQIQVQSEVGKGTTFTVTIPKIVPHP